MIAGVVGAALGIIFAVLAYWFRIRVSYGSVKARSEQIIKDAEVERERVLRAAEVEAKDALLAKQQEHEQEMQKAREEIAAAERRARQRETNIERKNELLERRERDLKKRENAIVNGEQRCARMTEEAQQKFEGAQKELERVAGLSQEQARQELVAALEENAHKEAMVRIRRIEEEAAANAEDNARKTIATAISRMAGQFVAEKTVSVVELPSDDMKGRIIGREGRNIRAIEAATGVDIIIDDTPEVVIVSAFNPIRREIARLALLHLVSDGRIHPARIEEVVAQAKEEVEELVVRAGEQATFDLGLHGVHPELIKLVGRLKYRTINGQNAWTHSVETATIAGMLAAELGLNPLPAKRAGLLHDIGKAVEHEVEGDHASISAEQARRFGEKGPVVTAIRHHHDADPPTMLSVLVQAANSLSKLRPGARKEMLETYVKRLEDLERVSRDFPGVQEAFVIQAGREIRVMVDFAQVSDDEAYSLSRSIARRIEDEMSFPGEVRITVIREARAVEIAR